MKARSDFLMWFEQALGKKILYFEKVKSFIYIKPL